jgi:MoaA/NifB/PqqE/SkfB family radical SAM enzyme
MHERLESFKAQNRPAEISADVIKKLIREASEMRIPSLILIGGEPFLEPRLFEWVAFALGQGISGITVVTNGTMMSEEIIGKIFACGLSNLSVSIDAATEATFGKIRGEKVLGRVMKNIDFLNEMKQKENRHTPNIVSVCTIMNQNLEELLDVVHLCRKLGISRIIFQPAVADNTDQTQVNFDSPVFVRPSRFDVLDKAIDQLIIFKKGSREQHDFIANSISQLTMFKRYFRADVKGRETPCYAGFNRLQVVQQGGVYFCANQAKHETVFGDVAKDSLKQLWFSREARFRRKLIRKCATPCLQWCSTRDEIIELSDELSRMRKK